MSLPKRRKSGDAHSTTQKRLTRYPHHRCAECLLAMGFGGKLIVRFTGIALTTLRRLRQRRPKPTLRRGSANWTKRTKANALSPEARERNLIKRWRTVQARAFAAETRAVAKAERLHWASHPAVVRWQWSAAMRRKWRASGPGSNFQLKGMLRRRIRKVLLAHRVTKAHRSEQLVGCQIHELRSHIERQFSEGMSWGNYGQWHVDHIVPCAAFDLTSTTEQRACFHYTNMRPLWARENIIKSSLHAGVKHRHPKSFRKPVPAVIIPAGAGRGFLIP